ncbi:SusF/SusE family outer membrane protein [Paraflavisolibacter sp. H34]|uniref:SusF/SusE family outer membrane protein n=1 Tax=Huijunlia imazamoxiresistens TaxID=3127457 RepID=UPI00301B13E8
MGTKLWFLLAFISLGFFSCKKELEQKVQPDDRLQLTAATTELVLLQKNGNNTALDLAWTTGSNGGTNASIAYTLELDKQGAGFSSPYSVYLGKGVYNQKFTAKELNDLVLQHFGFQPGVAGKLEARVRATVAKEAAASQVSPVLSMSIKPFFEVSATLYLVGEAAPNGWDNSKAAPLTPGSADPTEFTYQGSLKKGSFKFITRLGEWIPSYNKGAKDTDLFYRTDFGQPDDPFMIDEAGVYKIVVNLVAQSISVEKQAGPAHARLWIIGDATPKGWDINNPAEMQVDPSDPFVFTYNEVLKAGEFKIPVTTGNFATDYYMPLINHPDLSTTGVRLVAGGNPDHKWKITTPGAYKITLNIRDMTLSIKPFTPYGKLWMVGSATPNGWDINHPNEMVKDAANPMVFTYSGPLAAGEFKIPTATGNWGTDYFMPAVNHQDLGNTTVKFIAGGNPDNKWEITQAGNYTVTLNQLYETITIVKQ